MPQKNAKGEPHPPCSPPLNTWGKTKSMDHGEHGEKQYNREWTRINANRRRKGHPPAPPYKGGIDIRKVKLKVQGRILRDKGQGLRVKGEVKGQR